MSSKTKKNKKASPKKSGMSKAELQSSLTAVRSRLTKAEAKLAKATDKAERWKKEAAAQRTSAAKSEERVGTAAGTSTRSVPDESWTVVQLRAEARARGLVGMSNTPKARLLAALS